MNTTKKEWTVLILLIGICLTIELIGGWLTAQSVTTWYPHLVKPKWTPPNFIFGPTWTILYLLMACSLWLIWKTNSKNSKKIAYALFWGQLLLNLIWSGLFFTLRSPLLGLIDISLLLILVVSTIACFYRINKQAAYLLVPYLLWLCYAAALNYKIWQLNPSFILGRVLIMLAL